MALMLACSGNRPGAFGCGLIARPALQRQTACLQQLLGYVLGVWEADGDIVTRDCLYVVGS
jgi:hypothetical protein